MARWKDMAGKCMAVALAVLVLLGCAVPQDALADKSVTLTLVGDVTLGGENYLQGRETSFSGFARAHGYAYFLANVADLFASDDVTVVNLEGTLTDSSAQEDKGKTYRFRAPREMIAVLVEGSVEAVNLTNNHVRDFGNQGWRNTTETLKEAGIGYFGGTQSYIWEGENGIRIGFLGLYSSEINKTIENVIKQTARMKSEGVDAVVVSFHMGVEYAPQHHRSQNWAANKMIEAGADLVVMHHPHVVQGVDIIGDRTVFYSLGNFCFGGNSNVRAIESMVVRVRLDFSDYGEYLGQQVDIYPAHISGTYPNSNFQPVLVTGEEAAGVMKLIQDDTAFQLPAVDEETGYARLPYLPAQPEPGPRVLTVMSK